MAGPPVISSVPLASGPAGSARPRGRHCTLEATGAPADRLDDARALDAAIRRAVTGGGGTLLELVVRQFEPQGVTAVAVLAESHLSVHTWPEHGYAAIDAFTCGSADPERMCRSVAASLGAASMVVRQLDRGPQVTSPDGGELAAGSPSGSGCTP